MAVRFLEEVLKQLEFLKFGDKVIRELCLFNIRNDGVFDLCFYKMSHLLSDFLKIRQ